MNNDGYVFRRIRGRIVRIKASGNQNAELKKRQLAGAGIAAGGALLAVESGNLYRNTSFSSLGHAYQGLFTSEKISKKFGSDVSKSLYSAAQNKGIFSGVVSKFQQISTKTPLKEKLAAQLNYHVATSKALANVSSGIRKYGVYGGAGLIGYGTAKFLHNYAKDKKKKISPETIAAVGVGAGGAGIWAAKKADDLFVAGFVGRKHAVNYISTLAIEKAKSLGSMFAKKVF